MNAETPDLRWFEKNPKCPCGKTATGILRGCRNESYGHHCDRCAARRLKASQQARDKFDKLVSGGAK